MYGDTLYKYYINKCYFIMIYITKELFSILNLLYILL